MLGPAASSISCVLCYMVTCIYQMMCSTFANGLCAKITNHDDQESTHEVTHISLQEKDWVWHIIIISKALSSKVIE